MYYVKNTLIIKVFEVRNNFWRYTHLGIKIIGVGKNLPERVVTNDEMAQYIDTDNEWIMERTGIAQRHVATTEKSLDMAAAAAQKLGQPLDKFQISIKESANVSSATVPMALYDLQSSGKLQKGDIIAVMGFGGGLCAAGAIIEW